MTNDSGSGRTDEQIVSENLAYLRERFEAVKPMIASAKSAGWLGSGIPGDVRYNAQDDVLVFNPRSGAGSCIVGADGAISSDRAIDPEASTVMDVGQCTQYRFTVLPGPKSYAARVSFDRFLGTGRGLSNMARTASGFNSEHREVPYA